MAQVILWFRKDLRLSDNPALQAALKTGHQILPLFIWSPEEEAPWAPGAASRWWLDQSLNSLSADLKKKGSFLLLRRGPTLKTLEKLVKESGAVGLFWNRCYEPRILGRDKLIQAKMRHKGLLVESFPSNLLFEPWTLKSKTGNPFQVFTPFYKACLAQENFSPPLPTPKKIPSEVKKFSSLELQDLQLGPKINWAKDFRKHWCPGEIGAHKELRRFLKDGLSHYETHRDHPDQIGTSRLSPHLHFGEISPRQIWQTSQKKEKSKPFLREVIWREFAHHLLYHFPHTHHRPLRGLFENFSWKKNSMALASWQEGKTGYPIVDAGMRELWATGWMHNRVRMIVASFLVKDLLIPWQEGARWFWDTLVDADLANNTLGWQWVAGCGADAAPFFRIFNPVRQGEKFDAKGDYVKRWVPELSKLGEDWIHQPWEAPEKALKEAGVVLGKNYPKPIIDHAFARERALTTYRKIKNFLLSSS